MRIVCISDTHCQHARLSVPDGDLLIHAGDSTNFGSKAETLDFLAWLSGQTHRHKVLVAGNHDFLFEEHPALARHHLPLGVTYLQDNGATVGGLKIWGSPVTPTFYQMAFNVDRGDRLAMHWSRIPPGTDVVVTHGPALGHGDMTMRGERVGSKELYFRLAEIKPLLHVCGHIHSGRGISEFGNALMVNAAICDEYHSSLAEPIVVDLIHAGGRWVHP